MFCIERGLAAMNYVGEDVGRKGGRKARVLTINRYYTCLNFTEALKRARIRLDPLWGFETTNDDLVVLPTRDCVVLPPGWKNCGRNYAAAVAACFNGDEGREERERERKNGIDP